jgi:DNA mismatch repair protein MutL
LLQNSKIHLLDENTINQIAAGEVIENTSSIIKELVENSLDANAQNIFIEILAGGRHLIKITDDGEGMSFEDIKLCIQRHATSKIQKAEDLALISTMGFRGEALSSIASVSRVKIFSKQKGALNGSKLIVEGGQIIEHCSVDCDVGTRIEVSALFFNAPVRKRFLKSVDSDITSCTKIVTELSLANPTKSFQLISNQKITIKCSKGDLRKRIEEVLGYEFLQDAYPCSYKDETIEIEGFISDPKKTRPNKSAQHLILNKRKVQCPALTFAILDAYATLLEPRRFPLFVLNINVDTTIVDVNVHPQKTEVRLRKENFIRSKVTNAIESAFNQHLNLNTSSPAFIDFEEPQFPKRDFSFNVSSYNYTSQEPFAFKDYGLEKSKNIDSEISIKQILPLKDTSKHQANLVNILQKTPELDFNFSYIKTIGIWKNFILIEKEGHIHFVDIKRLHHRLFYEEYKKNNGDKEPMQTLLLPIIFNFSPSESLCIESKLSQLIDMGIEIRKFEKNSFIVEAHSAILDEEIIKNQVESLLKNADEDCFIKFSWARAEKISIHQPDEAFTLIEKWKQLQCPLLCPKGLSIIWKLPSDKIFNWP